MELSFFNKTALFVTAAISAVMGPSYIKTDVDAVNLNYKNGEFVPLYYFLNTQNIGEKARFTVSSNATWLYAYREAQPSQQSVTMLTGNSLNFVLEIHPEQVSDGLHEAVVTITAASTLDSTVYDTKTIKVNLKKNIETIINKPTPSPTATPDQTLNLNPSPILTPALTPVVPTSTIIPTPIKTLFSTPKPKPFEPVKISGSPSITPLPPNDLYTSPSPYISPDIPPEIDPKKQNFIRRLWRFMRGLFS